MSKEIVSAEDVLYDESITQLRIRVEPQNIVEYVFLETQINSFIVSVRDVLPESRERSLVFQACLRVKQTLVRAALDVETIPVTGTPKDS